MYNIVLAVLMACGGAAITPIRGVGILLFFLGAGLDIRR